MACLRTDKMSLGESMMTQFSDAFLWYKWNELKCWYIIMYTLVHAKYLMLLHMFLRLGFIDLMQWNFANLVHVYMGFSWSIVNFNALCHIAQHKGNWSLCPVWLFLVALIYYSQWCRLGESDGVVKLKPTTYSTKGSFKVTERWICD